MKQEALTDYDFWKNYWLGKEGLAFAIPSNYIFTRELKQTIQQHQLTNLLEIGGFPGYYSVWAQKEFGVSATLLDFVILPEIVEDLKKANQLNEDIELWEKDLFAHEEKGLGMFDLVISNGLIEHFPDTEEILAKHIQYVKKGGQLFVSLPNFRGLNGWFQRQFDPENYAKHHIPCMDINFLRGQCEKLGLKHISVRYTGGFMLWLENEKQQPLWVKILKKACWLPLKIFFKIFPFQTKAFAPYILIQAEK